MEPLPINIDKEQNKEDLEEEDQIEMDISGQYWKWYICQFVLIKYVENAGDLPEAETKSTEEVIVKLSLSDEEPEIVHNDSLIGSKKKKGRVTWGDERSLELIEVAEAAEYDRKQLSYTPNRRTRRRNSRFEMCSPLQKKILVGVVVFFVVILIILIVVIFTVIVPQTEGNNRPGPFDP